MIRFRLLLAALALQVAALPQTEAQLESSRRAKELMAAQRFADAAAIYEKLVRELPANAGLRLNLAMSLHFSGQDEKAIPQFEAVLKQQPSALPALMLLGASHMRMGSPAKAVPYLETALTLAPDDLQGRAMLADGLLMLERYEQALPHLRKLAAATPENPKAWYGLGRTYEAIAQRAFDALEKTYAGSPWWLMLAAEARVKLGRNSAAFTLYRAVLEKQPTFRGAHAGLAEVYRKTNHADWAVEEDAMEKRLPSPNCAVLTSECHFLQGRFEQALSLALQRRTSDALYWQSKAANELARAAFSRLAKLPPSVEFHQLMAELYRNQGRHTESIREWKAALELAPGSANLEQELATSIYMSRDYAAAEKMARALLAKDPAVAELQFILGDSLMNQQQPEQALAPLRVALKLKKDYLAASAVLGRALVEIGQSAQAIPYLLAALPLDNDGSLHFQLSRAYRDTGEANKAAEALRTYRTLQRAAQTGEVELTAPRK